MKSKLAAAAKFVIPAMLVGVLLARVKPAEWEALRSGSINYAVLAAALGVALAAIALSFYRWWLLVRAQGITLSVLESFRLSSICFLLSFVSVGSVGGDLFKAAFLARRSPGKRIAAVASVGVDRVTGLMGLLIIVGGGLLARSAADPFVVAGLDIERIKIIVAVCLIGGLTTFTALIFGGKAVDVAIRRVATIPRIGGPIAHLAEPLRSFANHPWAMVAALVLSIGVQGGLVIAMDLIARAMFDAPPTLGEHFIIVPLGMLASALPITPGGVGVLELVIEGLYEVIPARTTDASGTLVALVFELVKVALALLGTVFYWTAPAEVTASLEGEPSPRRPH